MIKIAFIDQLTGLVNFIAVPANDLMYNEDEQYGDSIAKHVPFESDDTVVLETWHWDGTSFQQHAKKQYDYQIWDSSNFLWKLPSNYVDIIRTNGSTEVNQLASQKILSKYPIYKQLNIGRTPEAQVMYDWIDNVRNLSNIATANITQAVTQDEITTIVDNFKTELGNIV